MPYLAISRASGDELVADLPVPIPLMTDPPYVDRFSPEDRNDDFSIIGWFKLATVMFRFETLRLGFAKFFFAYKVPIREFIFWYVSK